MSAPANDTAATSISSADALTVQDLEAALFARYPRAWAEPWDHVGLSVGDPQAPVSGVACALDVTPAAVVEAASQGCNVLVSHHPVCLDMPATLAPARSGAPTPGSSMWAAIEEGVALIAMHTNLDRSRDAVELLPHALGFMQFRHGLERGRDPELGSLGALVQLEDAQHSVRDIAQQCHTVFGRPATVYGDPGARLLKLAFYSGSLGPEGIEDVRASGAEAVICGECGYHRALDLVSSGCAVIILGHDVSELPHAGALHRAVTGAGVPQERVFTLDEARRWTSI